MSSHIFEEVQRSCDRAGIIREGYLAAVEDIKSLNEMKHKNFIVNVSGNSDIKTLQASPLIVKKLSEKKALIEVRNNYDEFFKILSSCHVTGLEVKQQSLEDIFMKYYGEEDHE